MEISCWSLYGQNYPCKIDSVNKNLFIQEIEPLTFKVRDDTELSDDHANLWHIGEQATYCLRLVLFQFHS